MSQNIIDRLLAAKNKPSIRVGGFLLALALFAAGLIWALRQNPTLFQEIHWTPFLLLIIIGVPLTFVLNAFDIMLTARLAGSKLGLATAFKVGVLSRAANMLPLPGGPVIRIAALKDAGAGLKQSTSATALAAAIWLGVSFLFAGLCLIAFSGLIAALLIVLGASALIGSCFYGYVLHKNTQSIAWLVGLKVLVVLVGALRLTLCLWALTGTVNFIYGLILGAATVAASIIVILPDGLGAREVISGALAAIIGVGAGTGVLVAVVNRIGGLIAICPIALYLAFSSRKPSIGVSETLEKVSVK